MEKRIRHFKEALTRLFSTHSVEKLELNLCFSLFKKYIRETKMRFPLNFLTRNVDFRTYLLDSPVKKERK